MKKFILISPKNRTAYNFRGDLIQDISAKGYDVIVTGPNRDNIDRIEALGARFVEIPMNKTGVNPFSDLKYTYRLFNLFRKERPEIILGYTIKPVIYGSIAARMARVKNVTSMVTGIGYLFASKTTKAKIIRQISSILYRIGFKCSDNIIFQNKDDQEEFISYKLCDRSKTHVVNGSGVNMLKFKPTVMPDQLTFFFLGRFIYSKGILDFLEAASIIKSKYPELRFIILGKFENINDAVPKEIIDSYVDNGIVEHFPETDNIAKYYAQTSVFVLPTYYREGTPRVILEAMACARPIITTFTPGCKETVIDGINGFFVESKNPEQLAQKMEEFIKNPDLVSQMGNESYKICKDKYDVNIINKEMLNIMKL